MNISKRNARNLKEGLSAEYKVMRILKRSNNLAVIRSSGSHSPFDLIAINPDKTRLIQVKRNHYIEPKERRKLLNIASKLGSHYQIEIFYYSSPRILKKAYITKAGEEFDEEIVSKRLDKFKYKLE